MAILKWTRWEKTIGKNALKTGESIYNSTDGRFTIHQRKVGRRTWIPTTSRSEN